MIKAKAKASRDTVENTVGKMVDDLFRQKIKIDKLAEKRKEWEEKEKEEKRILEEMKSVLLTTFNKEDVNGAVGKTGKVVVSKTTLPDVKNWPEVYNYIYENKAWDMLQKRVSTTAYRARLEEGEQVPGIKKFVKVDLKISKR